MRSAAMRAADSEGIDFVNIQEPVAAAGPNYPSLVEIRAVIPKHCFQASAWRSWSYVLRDFLIIAGLFYLAHTYIPGLEAPFRQLAWAAYWLAQGTMFWALFVLGHDAGHGAFGPNRLLNDVAGALVHTVILLPYASFQLTHRNHHMNCAHFVRDEGYGPMDENCPLDRRTRRVMLLPFAAYWLYMFGLSRHGTSHFSPNSKLFERNRPEVVRSLALIAVVVLIAAAFAYRFGIAAVMAYYGLPVLVYGCYFMIVTFQQHNDINMPWYGDPDWTFVKGALSSVDRSYGPFNWIVHNIGTHQLHHLFPSIPHYHLREATEHFAAAFPLLRRRAGGVPIVAYFTNVRNYIRFGDVPSGEYTFVYDDVMRRYPAGTVEQARMQQVKGTRA
jgi:omega-3 fatty acid desaturase (delta-15 desaturase)